MNSQWITECPHCGTSFRVTEQHLRAAKGSVRCGSCLQVFNAINTLFPGDDTTTVTSPSTAFAPIAQPIARAVVSDEDEDDTNWDEALDEEEDDETPLQQNVEDEWDAPGNTIEETLEEDDTDYLIPNDPDSEYSDDDDDILLRSPKPEDDSTDTFGAADNDWPEEAPVYEPREPHIGPYREPFRDDALLNELEAEPPEFNWHEPPTAWGKTILWSVLSLIALTVLAAQYVLSHYADFAATLEKPPYQQWVTLACQHVSCARPKTDMRFITNDNLVVRTHPTEPGALLVDTLMYNRAAFPQAFPVMDLRFSDINNKLLAERRFTPTEYLTGELATLTEMPINTPVHISLAIKSPSPDATNYELILVDGAQ